MYLSPFITKVESKKFLSRGCDPRKDEIYFKIKFRLPKSFKDNNPLITYELSIGFDFELNQAFVSKELLKYKSGNFGKPWHLLDFKQGLGKVKYNDPQSISSFN